MDVAQVRAPVAVAQMRVFPSSRGLLAYEVFCFLLVPVIIISQGSWESIIFPVVVSLCGASTCHVLRGQESAARQRGLSSYQAHFRGPAALVPGGAMLLMSIPFVLIGLLFALVGGLVAVSRGLSTRLRSINFPRHGPTRGML